MIYEKAVLIPKNTPQTAPVVETLEVHPGKVNRVEIIFPSGCVGLVHLQIFLWERQVWPSNVDSNFSGDDAHLEFQEDLDLVSPPYAFDISGWNDDDTYPHKPIVRFQITPLATGVQQVLAIPVGRVSGPIVQVGG